MADSWTRWVRVASSQTPCLARTPRLPRLTGGALARAARNVPVLEMKPTIEATAVISPEVLFQEIGGEAVLLDLASERYFGLDDVGTRIWQLLQDQGSLRVVYDRMLDEYDVEPTRLEEDLLKHVGELAEAGLLIVREGDAPAP